MTKVIFAILVVPYLVIITATSSCAFEIFGCWESDQKDPLNVIRFKDDTYYYGRNSLPATYSQDSNTHIVTFLVDSEIRIVPEGEDSIKVTYPDPSLPKNIVYKRISEDEAMKLIKKR